MVEDLVGLGKVGQAILDKIAAATGTLYEPTRIRRIGRAQADVEAELILKRTAAELEADDMRQRHLARLDKQTEADPVLLRERASRRLITRELGRQKNIESVVHESLAHTGGDEPRDIDDDWIETFIEYAQSVSVESIRAIWARLLAMQADERQPTISRATLDALRLLEPRQAEVFRRAIYSFVANGQIMDIDANGNSEISFNVNSLQSMALEDIGFLKRVREKEAGLAFRWGTFTFWNPYFRLAGKKEKTVVWQSTQHLKKVLPIIREIARGDERDAHDLLRETPIDRYILTSRGYELAAILFPGFYEAIAAGDGLDVATVGPFADGENKDKVAAEWADEFSRKGSVVILNRVVASGENDGVALPQRLYDAETKRWIDVSTL